MASFPADNHVFATIPSNLQPKGATFGVGVTIAVGDEVRDCALPLWGEITMEAAASFFTFDEAAAMEELQAQVRTHAEAVAPMGFLSVTSPPGGTPLAQGEA